MVQFDHTAQSLSLNVCLEIVLVGQIRADQRQGREAVRHCPRGRCLNTVEFIIGFKCCVGCLVKAEVLFALALLHILRNPKALIIQLFYTKVASAFTC